MSMKYDSVKVSAVTSVRNQENTIAQTVKSVLALGNAIEEYLILDDASTDGTGEILRELATVNPVIRLLHNERNVGCVAGFRRLFGEARGNYVLGIAGDDYLLPDGMKKLIEFAVAQPGMGLYFGDIIIDFCDEKRLCHSRFKLSETPRVYAPEEIGSAIRGMAIPSAGMLIDKRYISDPAIYLSDLQWLADWLGNLIIAFRSGAGYVPEETVVWRVYESNYSSKSKVWSKQKALLTAMIQLLRTPQYVDIYDAMTRWRLFDSIAPDCLRLLLTVPECRDRRSIAIFMSCFRRMLRDHAARFVPGGLKQILRGLSH